MKRTLATATALGVLVALAPSSAIAGSNNGSRDWYWLKRCWIGKVTNLEVSNYDKNSGGWTKQEYHIDADKGTTRIFAMVVLMDGRSTFRWNDFYVTKGDWSAHTLTLSTNLGRCSIRG